LKARHLLELEITHRCDCTLLMHDTTHLLKLFQLSRDGPSSRCLFSIFPMVTSLHLNNWFCLPVPQHRHSLLLGGKLPFCVHRLCTFQHRHCRLGNQHKNFSAVLSSNAIHFPVSLKLCDLCKFEMW
jgi:hypothetical protein